MIEKLEHSEFIFDNDETVHICSFHTNDGEVVVEMRDDDHWELSTGIELHPHKLWRSETTTYQGYGLKDLYRLLDDLAKADGHNNRD